MGLINWLVGKKSGTPSLDDVLREQKRLSIREEQTIRKLEKLDQERETLFEKGAKESSTVRRRQMARLYNQRTEQVRLMERDLNLVSKQLITITAIRTALERKQQLEQRGGLTQLLAGMNEAELAHILEDDKISYDLYVERLNSVLGTINDAEMDLETNVGKEGAELISIWERMDEGEFDSFDSALKEADNQARESLKDRDLLAE
jgi:hypothetical protein